MLKYALNLLLIVILVPTSQAFWASSFIQTAIPAFNRVIKAIGPQSTVARSPPNCQPLATSGDCGFYSCYESVQECTTVGYNLGYGEKFCNQLLTKRPSYDADGQTFVDCFRKCQINKLQPYSQTNSLSCAQIKTTGFNTFSTCFSDCNICSIATNNQKALVETFQIDYLINLGIWEEFCEMIGNCMAQAQQQLQVLGNQLGVGIVSDAMGLVQSITKDACAGTLHNVIAQGDTNAAKVATDVQTEIQKLLTGGKK